MLIHVLGGPQWSFTVHGPEEFDKASLIGLAEKVRRCSFVVAVSSFGRSQLFRLTAQEYWSKVHVMRCGLDRSFLTAPANLALSRRLVCVGRLCEQKGQLLLVEAAHQLAVEGTGFELVLAGDGELRERIEALILRYNLGTEYSNHWLDQQRKSARGDTCSAGACAAELRRRTPGGPHGSDGFTAAGHYDLRRGDS